MPEPFSATASVKSLPGTAAKPGVTFTGDEDTGLYRSGANELAVAVGGAEAAKFTATQTSLKGDINLDDGGTFTTTVQCVTPTAARTISFPDATGTVGLVAGSSGNLVANQSGAYAGVANSSVDSATGNITLGSRFISTLNGALSATGIAGVPLAVTGTWIAAGGTATTTKPQVLIEPTGATSTAWSTAGTGLGVNAASGFTGRLLDLQLNGTSNFNVSSTGAATGASLNVTSSTVPANGVYLPAANTVGVATNGSGRLFINSSGQVGVGTSSPTNLIHASQLSNTAYDSTNINGLSHTVQLANTSTTTETAASLLFQVTGTGGSALGGISLIHTGASAGALTFATRGGSSATPERMRLTSTGLGIGTTSPNELLEVAGNIHVSGADRSIFNRSNNALTFGTNNTERARIDSSGRLLVGASTARDNFFNTGGFGGRLQIEGANATAQRVISNVYGASNTGGPIIVLAKHRSDSVGGTTIVASGDECGLLSFQGSDGTEFVEAARIAAEVDGTPGANDMPGRLVFSTTADGASSPTERLRITSAGLVGIGTSSPAYLFHAQNASADTNAFVGQSSTVGLFNQWRYNATTANAYGEISTYGGANNLYIQAQSGGGNTILNPTSGNVGIGTSSPGQSLDVVGAINSQNNASTIVHFQAQDTGAATDEKTWRIAQTNRTNKTLLLGISVNDAANTAYTPITITRSGVSLDNIQFATGNGTERARIDSSGRLLVGTVSSSIGGSGSIILQGATGPGVVRAMYGSTSPGTNDVLGAVTFGDASHTGAAYIYASRDGGTWVSNSSQPATITFGTAPNGSNAALERLRITSEGNVGIGTSSPVARLDLGLGSSTNYAGTERLVFPASPAATGIASLYGPNVGTSNRTYLHFVGAGAGSTFAIGIQGYQASNPASTDYIKVAPGLTNGDVSYYRFDANGFKYFADGSKTTGDADYTPTERFRITSAGLVGIGTSSPGVKLEVYGTSNANEIRSSDGTITGQWYQDINGYSIFGTVSNHPQVFRTNSNERARITSAGLVGIGTSSPTEELNVIGDIALGVDAHVNQGTYYLRGGNKLQGADAFNAVSLYLKGGDASIGSGAGSTGAGNIIISGGDATKYEASNGLAGNVFIRGGTVTTGGFGGNVNPGYIQFDTAGTERLRITSAGLVGIGTSSPSTTLHVAGTPGTSTTANLLSLRNGSASNAGNLAQIDFWCANTFNGNEAVAAIQALNPNASANNGGALVLAVSSNGTATTPSERARLDSSGRLLVGTSTARENFYNSASGQFAQVQIEGTDYKNSALSLTCNATIDNHSGTVVFNKSAGASVGSNTLVSSGETLGGLQFQGNDGAEFVQAANIFAEIDGTPGANDMPGRLVFSTTADGASSPTEAMRINNQRELLIGTTTRTANGGVLQISNGITFPGTQSACSDPNTLDDYEEGTWTPTISGASTAGTGTYTTQSGRYTKVGRSVYAAGMVAWSAHDGTGTMRIAGLPFTSVNVTELANAASFTYFSDITVPANSIPIGGNFPNTTLITLYSMAVAGGTPNGLGMDASGTIYFSLTYQAA